MDVIIIITAFCLANDGHLLFSAQWLRKPPGVGEQGRGGVLTRGWLIYWAASSSSSRSSAAVVALFFPSSFSYPFSSLVLLGHLVRPSVCPSASSYLHLHCPLHAVYPRTRPLSPSHILQLIEFKTVSV